MSHNGSDPLCASMSSGLDLLEPVCAYGAKRVSFLFGAGSPLVRRPLTGLQELNLLRERRLRRLLGAFGELDPSIAFIRKLQDS